jgi:hypothetical protein
LTYPFDLLNSFLLDFSFRSTSFPRLTKKTPKNSLSKMPSSIKDKDLPMVLRGKHHLNPTFSAVLSTVLLGAPD